MPNLGQFAQAWFWAAGVAAVIAATARLFYRPRQDTARGLAAFAVAAGAVAGFGWLRSAPRFPPTGGLDRLLVIVLPAAVLVEVLSAVFAARSRPVRVLVWALRALVAAGVAPVVLWGSVYVSGLRREWTPGETVGVYAGIGAAVYGFWLLMVIGNRRMTWAGAAATTVSLQSTGIVMFLALYLGGGKASLPLAGALSGALAVSLVHRDRSERSAHDEGLLSLAIVGLAGLLLVGRFFSRVTSWEAVALGLAPLLTLAGELPVIRRRRPWIAATMKLALAALPPAIVVYLAKRAFDQSSKLLM